MISPRTVVGRSVRNGPGCFLQSPRNREREPVTPVEEAECAEAASGSVCASSFISVAVIKSRQTERQTKQD